jgi:hypothetical protein
MFFIGLFSGYIPYLILLAVSSLCMVTFTIEKVKAEKEDSSLEYAAAENIAKISDEKAIHYDDVQIEDQSILIDEEIHTPIIFNRIRHISFNAHRKKHFNTYYASLFPNPPPFHFRLFNLL